MKSSCKKAKPMNSSYKNVFFDLVPSLYGNNSFGFPLYSNGLVDSDSEVGIGMGNHIGITDLMQLMEEDGPLSHMAAKLHKSGVSECYLSFYLESKFRDEFIYTSLSVKFLTKDESVYGNVMFEIEKDMIPSNATPEMYEASLRKAFNYLFAKPELESEESTGPSQ